MKQCLRAFRYLVSRFVNSTAFDGLLIFATAMLIVFAVSGCRGTNSIAGFMGRHPVTGAPLPTATAVDEFAFLNWLGFVCIAGGIAALVASTFIAIIPQKAAITAIVCGIGSVCLKVFMVKFLPVLLWVSFGLLAVGAVMMLYPWVVAWVNRNLKKDALHLTLMGDTRAAAALHIAAERRKFNPQDPKTFNKRKALLLKLEAQANRVKAGGLMQDPAP